MNKDVYKNINNLESGRPLNSVEIPKIFDDAKKEKLVPREDLDSDSSHHNLDNWNKFRNILSYFIECLKLEEGFDSICKLSDSGSKYIYLFANAWHPKTDLNGAGQFQFHQWMINSFLN